MRLLAILVLIGGVLEVRAILHSQDWYLRCRSDELTFLEAAAVRHPAYEPDRCP